MKINLKNSGTNDYFVLLYKIITYGLKQNNKKGNITFLINEKISFSYEELLTFFSYYPLPKEKLEKELELYLKGETAIIKYNKANITWWNYIGDTFVNSYPTYFKKLPSLLQLINSEKRNSKNYVFYNGETNVQSSQQPCVSLIQFQLIENELYITVYQRSADCNLGLPADLYQVWLISQKLNFTLKNITFFIGNAHIYENNKEDTEKLLKGENYIFKLNV